MKRSYLLFGLLILTLISCNDNDDIVTTDLYPENLVAYYPFNGNSLNEINFENNGLVDGATLTSDIGGSLNSAFSFDGIDDIIKIDHNSIFNLSNDFTISALIKPEEIKTQHIVRKGTFVNGTGRWPYGISLSATGDIVFSVTTENGQILNQARREGYQINEWYLITGVFKESEMLLYVNGELEVSEITNGQLTTNTEDLLIGSRLGLQNDTFKGSIDEVRIYNVGLNEFEIREIYNNL
jgi:methyl coenzyme M reductase subunit C-like uncharacterized protein (methanogenesis marker protein 7)